VNGSLKGYDEYAYTNNFPFEPPTQALWLTHPEFGITISMPVFVDHKVMDGKTYTRDQLPQLWRELLVVPGLIQRAARRTTGRRSRRASAATARSTRSASAARRGNATVDRRLAGQCEACVSSYARDQEFGEVIATDDARMAY
jgi:hypothetical protein